MMRPTAILTSFVGLLLLAPAGAVDVTVNLNYSTYVGTAQTGGTGVSEWLGIRYAAPPVGDLRFKRPQDPVVNTTTQLANQHGKICLATNGDPADTTTSEDCLFLDVFAPSNATTNSKLPVYVFIQGGGFNTNSNANYNGTGLVTASGNNIVVVTFNYRVGPYGFLTNGNEFESNNALFDQRKVFQWVQDNIALFGGDPDHVTLGGASAGAASISLHLTAYGALDEGFFHAAAAESVSFATVLTVNESRYQFDNLALRLGCVGTDAQAAACLRNKTAVELQELNYDIPYPGAAAPPVHMYSPVIDGDFLQDLPYVAFEQGNFIQMPVLFGDDTNGGTVFVPSNISTLANCNMFVKNTFPAVSLEDFATINQLYPNYNDTCPSTGCYWRQCSNAYGEMRYMCPGLYISAAFANYGVPQSYAYRWDVEDPTEVAMGYGVPHTAEVSAIFGPSNTGGGYASASYFPGEINEGAVTAAQGYWTSFIRTYDPNTYRAAGSAEWGRWNDTTQSRLLFSTGGATSMEALAGSELMDRCDFWYSIGVEIKQ